MHQCIRIVVVSNAMICFEWKDIYHTLTWEVD